jgi:hypothetical protein
MDAQEKDSSECIDNRGEYALTPGMQRFAGEVRTIESVLSDGSYELEGILSSWEDWMFDPDYRPEDEPLSAEEAVRAMLDGETLYNRKDQPCRWVKKDYCFSEVFEDGCSRSVICAFTNLYRRPAKRIRPWTRWEVLAWASGEESRGWVVRHKTDYPVWVVPQYPVYDDDFRGFQRARLLPDHSGIDESTIQGFETEE